MKLIQILLPLYSKTGRRLPRALLHRTAESFAQEYGGITAYMRAPARGLWLKGKRTIDRDDVVIFEIMLKTVNRAAWARRRRVLERAFQQDKIVIRALSFNSL
jgi:hypothetical protein